MARLEGLRLPGPGTGDTQEQLRQLRNYLYQLTEQLQYALAEGEQNQAQTFARLREMLQSSPELMDAVAGTVSRRYDGRYLLGRLWEPYAAGQETLLRETAIDSRRGMTALTMLSELFGQLENRGVLEDPCLIPLRDADLITGLELGRRQQLGDRICYTRVLRLENGALTLWDPEGKKRLFLGNGTWRAAPDENGHLTLSQLI